MHAFKHVAILAASVAAISMPGAAWAQREPNAGDFPACDGYGAPGRTTDGMSRGVSGLSALWMGGTGSSQLRRNEPRYGRQGIAICTDLLNYRYMLPEYRLRRASLLEARALHRLAAGEAREAIADLDLAREAAGSGDPLAERSFLLGLRLVRAFAQLKAGDSAAAAREAEAVLAARPYETDLALAAAQLHFAAARDWTAYLGQLRNIARVDPNIIPTLFTFALFRGEFEEMIALHPQIVISTPRSPSGGYDIPGRNAAVAEAMVRRALLDGAYAYALQARGRNADADAAIAAGRRALEASMAPPVPPQGRERPTRAQRDLYAAMQARQAEADEMLTGWERMVRLRRMVAEGNVAGVVADLETKRIDPTPAALDLFEAMIQARPGLRSEIAGMIDQLRHGLASQVDRALDLSVQELANALPEPESPQRMPAYDGGGGLDGNGYRALPGSSAGTQTIRFSSARGSISVASEMALLRAAELARQSGHRGLLIVTRRGVLRSTTMYSAYGFRGATTASGQEAELEVAFVDPAALPAAFGNAGWRVLDADAIWSTLSPIYRPPAPAR